MRKKQVMLLSLASIHFLIGVGIPIFCHFTALGSPIPPLKPQNESATNGQESNVEPLSPLSPIYMELMDTDDSIQEKNLFGFCKVNTLAKDKESTRPRVEKICLLSSKEMTLDNYGFRILSVYYSNGETERQFIINYPVLGFRYSTPQSEKFRRHILKGSIYFPTQLSGPLTLKEGVIFLVSPSQDNRLELTQYTIIGRTPFGETFRAEK